MHSSRQVMEEISRRKRHEPHEEEPKHNHEDCDDGSHDDEEFYENTVHERPCKQRRQQQQQPLHDPIEEDSTQEPELPLAQTLDEFRQNPHLYRPRREWFQCSYRQAVFACDCDSSFSIPKVHFGEDRDSALHHCIRLGNVDAAHKLILEGPPRIVQVVNLKIFSPLILAAQNGHLGLVKLLLERGANVSHVTRNGSTVALQAAHFGHLDVVKLVVGINKELLERWNQRRTTPLMRACQEKHPHVVKFLCEQGVRVNEKNLQGMTALMLASQRGHTEICEYLVQRGADLNAITEQGSTSLILACKRQHLQTVEVLVRAGAELYIKDGRGRTARDICLVRSNTSRRRRASNPEILQKLTALLDPSAQVDLMRLQARKDRSFSWIRIWILLQQDRARLRGVEDLPFHSSVEMAEQCRMFSPASMAWFRMLALPAPLVRHIAEFCPLPNHFDRRINLLLNRCTHDANSALMACFDIIDEVLEDRGFLVALDRALIPPPGNYLSWAAWRQSRIRNSRVAKSIEDITSREPLDQLQQHAPQRPIATAAKLRPPHDSDPITEHRRHVGYLDILAKYHDQLEPILTNSPFDLQQESVERLALSSDLCSVVRRLGWHSGCGSFSSAVAMDLISFTIRLGI